MIKYSIGIVTFEKRFDKFFKPLLETIKQFRPDIEVMVSINGQHNAPFNQTYRSEFLQFVSAYPNVFPSFHPTFRSLAKLWNNLLIDASNHLMLLLNDDVTIAGEDFFDELEKTIEKETFFKINGSWSHTLLDRRLIAQLGWFDERFLGVGEEDGDMEWQIGHATNGGTIKSINLPSLINHVDAEGVLDNIQKTNVKYTQFNVDMAHGYKYEINPASGVSYGINPRPLLLKNPKPPLHLAENFYWDNRDKL